MERLAEIFLELQEKGAANLNLVTGAHYVPHIISALELARGKEMSLPVVYNSSGYESVETIRRLDGYVDVYLPDMKYMEPELAAAFSNARDYPQAAQSAIAEMMRQTGPCQFAEDGYIKRGTIVRHLILPGHTKNSIAVLKYLYRTYGEDIFISVMNQYTPVWKNEKFPELNKVLDRLAEKYGVTQNAIAVAWIMRHPAGIQTIVGSTNLKRIQDISKASDIVLSREEWYEIYLAAGKMLP